MTTNFNPKLLFGAASMAAGMIKTLASSLRKQKSWPEKAKEALSINRNVLLGTVAGGIIGVTTALLLAPERKKGQSRSVSKLVDGNSEKKKASPRTPRKRKPTANHAHSIQ